MPTDAQRERCLPGQTAVLARCPYLLTGYSHFSDLMGGNGWCVGIWVGWLATDISDVKNLYISGGIIQLDDYKCNLNLLAGHNGCMVQVLVGY